MQTLRHASRRYRRAAYILPALHLQTRRDEKEMRADHAPKGELNIMETSQTKIDISQASAAYEAEQAKAKEDQIANSKFVKLKDGEQKDFLLTGIVFTEDKEFEPGKGLKKLFSFELSEVNAKGENKQFSCSARSQVAGELIKAIRENKKRIIMKRSGEGNKTTYTILALLQ